MLTIGNTSISLLSLVQIAITLIFVIFIGKVFKRFLKNKILNQLNIDPANRETLANVISYFSGAILFILLLQYFGVNISTLAVIGGGLGLGLGFGLQDITKNFVSGLILLFERPIKPGDFLEMEGIKGYIQEISTRSTLITTQDGAEVFIPNSFFTNHRFTNWSYSSFTARIRIKASVAYGSDLVIVTELLLRSAYQESRVLSDPSPEVLFMGFGDNSLDFELRAWINPIDEEPEIRSNLNFTIEYLFRQNNISIPFPQRDIWVRNSPDLPLVKNSVGHTNGENKELTDSQKLKASVNKINLVKPPQLTVKDMLLKVDYFKNLNALEIRKLIQVGYQRNLEPEEILFKENQAGDAFYIILSGSVEVYVEKINKHLANLDSGSFFGELSLMLGLPRTATVKAREKTILFGINQENFKKLLMYNPDLYNVIITTLTERKNELKERQKELRKLGLIDQDEDDNNPIVWVKRRLQKFLIT